MVCAAGPARAVTLRYQANQAGDFILIGNTLAQDCGSQTPAPAVGTVGSCGSHTSDTSPDVFWRASDTGGATADDTITAANARSTATLRLPAGATVTYARVYWSAVGTSTTSGTTAFIDRPGSGSFSTTITADASARDSSTGPNFYQSTANVTALVQAHGAGAYRLGAIDSVSLNDVNDDSLYAGWAMVVLYALSTDPPRNLTIFDGLSVMQAHGADQTVTVTGFQVPTGAYDAKVGVIAYGGAKRGNGDSLAWNGTALSDAYNSATNFFNGTHTYLGTLVSTAGDLPQTTGEENSMSGMDLDVENVTSLVKPGDTSATVTASTKLDSYVIGAYITAIATVKPDFSASTKAVADLNSHPGGAVIPGDTLQYTITVSNTGHDTGTGVMMTDVLPAGLTFVPGSIQVTSGANTGTKTDASGDDQGEYLSASRTVQVRLGTGATASAGGTIAAGSSTTVVFSAKTDGTVLGTI